jgi:hypothetical protein
MRQLKRLKNLWNNNRNTQKKRVRDNIESLYFERFIKCTAISRDISVDS